MHDKRNSVDKLKTLLFGKDLRITKGDVFPSVYPFDYSSYYPEDEYIAPQQPNANDEVFDIRFYGANTENSDNAPFINKAIEEAALVGGTVLVDGGSYITTTVHLKSNVTLFITHGSALESNKTGVGYNHLGIIHADGCDNIKITGGGKVNGNGEYFGRKPLWDANQTEHPEVIDVVQMRRDYRAQLRFAHESKYGGPIYFKNCTNVVATNFIIEDSANWSFRIENCNNVDISDFVINNNRNVANADGFDIAGTSNLKISHCFVSTADDGICIKNAVWLGCDKPMENIHITNCEVISRTNSFKIGTETTNDIKNVTVDNCTFRMVDIYPGSVSGIAIESADGSKVSNVTVKNIKMDRVTCPIFIRLCNRNRAAKVTAQSANAIEFGQKAEKGASATADEFNMLGEINDIIIENVEATNVELPCIIAGYKQNDVIKRVKNVTLKNIDLKYAPYKEIYDKRMFIPEYVDVYPESWRFRNLPSYAIWARHISNLKLLDFRCSQPKTTWKKAYIIEDAE